MADYVEIYERYIHELREKLTAYYKDNTSELLSLTIEMQCETGNFDYVDRFDFDELCEIAAEGGADSVNELVRAAVYGETYGGMVRYNAYGNLDPAEDDDLIRDCLDYISDIICELVDEIDEDYSHYDISDDVQELIENIWEKYRDEYYDEDKEEYEEEQLQQKELEIDYIIKEIEENAN